MRSRRYSEQELVEFERAMRIVLPDAYRQYLCQVGAGLFTPSKVSLLEDWCQPYAAEELPADFLAQEFPHNTTWNDMTLLREQAGGQSPYFDRMLFRGSMRIGNLGCEAYDLLVVSGPERGTIWWDERASSRAGIHPRTGPHGGRLRVEDHLANIARAW